MGQVKEALMSACYRVIDEVRFGEDGHKAGGADLQPDYDAYELFGDVIGDYYGNIPACVLVIAKRDKFLSAYIPADAQHDDS